MSFTWRNPKPGESKENLAAAKKSVLRLNINLHSAKRNVPNEGKRDTCFIKYIEAKYKGKGKTKDRFNAVAEPLKTFADSETIPFKVIFKQWLFNFQELLSSGEERIENHAVLE